MGAAPRRQAKAGAFAPGRTYSAEALAALVAEAKDHGIMVEPEFDMPGHSRGWGLGHPEVMLPCNTQAYHAILGTLDPTLNRTYEIVAGFLDEMAGRGGVFAGSPMVGLCGDELPKACWQLNPAIAAWVESHNLTKGWALEQYFYDRALEGTTFVRHYAQEPFNNGLRFPPGTVIDIWTNQTDPAYPLSPGRVAAVIRDPDLRATTSLGWYLNHAPNTYGDGTWDKFWLNDPFELARADARYLGGCVWSQHAVANVAHAASTRCTAHARHGTLAYRAAASPRNTPRWLQSPLAGGSMRCVAHLGRVAATTRAKVWLHRGLLWAFNGAARSPAHRYFGEPEPTSAELGRIIGGEAKMWDVRVDQINFEVVVWPRAAAVADRLWAPAEARNTTDAARRMHAHRCRLLGRGVRASPLVDDTAKLDTYPHFCANGADLRDEL